MLNNLIAWSLRNRVIVLFQWAWYYLTFQRGARVITGEWHPASRGIGAGGR